jgi:phage-related protein
MNEEKKIRWVGTSRKDLMTFPLDALKEAGFQLGKVQSGLEPDNWKPFPSVGAGAYEIKIKEASGEFRVFYVAKFVEAIYVLHCFQKKSQQTARQDIDLGVERYREAVASRSEK